MLSKKRRKKKKKHDSRKVKQCLLLFALLLGVLLLSLHFYIIMQSRFGSAEVRGVADDLVESGAIRGKQAQPSNAGTEQLAALAAEMLSSGKIASARAVEAENAANIHIVTTDPTNADQYHFKPSRAPEDYKTNVAAAALGHDWPAIAHSDVILLHQENQRNGIIVYAGKQV